MLMFSRSALSSSCNASACCSAWVYSSHTCTAVPALRKRSAILAGGLECALAVLRHTMRERYMRSYFHGLKGGQRPQYTNQLWFGCRAFAQSHEGREILQR